MTKYDAFVASDANIDLIAHVDESFIAEHPFLQKGVFVKCLEQQAAYFLKNFSFKAYPGGTGANVVHTMSVLGSKPYYLGVLGKDAEALVFKDLYNLIGMDYKIIDSSLPSTKIFTFITPDGERTGASYYGASTELRKEHILEHAPQNIGYVYLDGYFLNQKHGLENLLALNEVAKKSGAKTLFAVNSTYIYSVNRDAVHKMVDVADILVFSEEEALLVSKESEIGLGLLEKFGTNKMIIVTMGERGSVVFCDGKEVFVDACKPNKPVIDCNGAGDNYVGGFLYGLSKGFDLSVCGKLGAAAATECIVQNGPRIKGLTQASQSEIEA